MPGQPVSPVVCLSPTPQSIFVHSTGQREGSFLTDAGADGPELEKEKQNASLIVTDSLVK